MTGESSSHSFIEELEVSSGPDEPLVISAPLCTVFCAGMGHNKWIDGEG